MSVSIDDMNRLSPEDFIRLIGPVFEHSPWIAERACPGRPYASREALHQALCEIVAASTREEQLGLIRAHPDLVGRVVLTSESQGEQTAAGLMDLTPEEVAAFDRYNRAYKDRFDFPFVICARKNKKEAILAAFPERLNNSPEQEQQTALEQIYLIAQLRINDLLTP